MLGEPVKKTIAILMAAVLALFLFSCAQPSKKDARHIDLADVMTRLSLYCDSRGSTVYAASPLDLWNFYGIDAAETVQYRAKSFTGEGEGAEILLFEAKDKASLAKIRAALQKRLDEKLHNLLETAPGQYALYRESRVASNGRFIRLIYSADAKRLAGLYDDFFNRQTNKK